MDNDFNTPNVLTLVQKIVKEMNQLLRNKDLTNLSLKTNTLEKILDILGISLEYNKLSEDDKKLYNEWEAYKKSRDFENADKIRAILIERGIL